MINDTEKPSNKDTDKIEEVANKKIAWIKETQDTKTWTPGGGVEPFKPCKE